jgi:hypothetical protein
VRHPHHRILGIGQRQPASDLLRRPSHRQLLLYHRPQPRLQHQLGRFRPLGAPEGGGIGGLGPVAGTAAVSDQLPRHRRRGSPQPRGDLPAGLPGGHATADLLAFGHAQTLLRAMGRVPLYASGLQDERADRGSALAQPASDQPQ